MISREDILALALGQLAPDDEQRVRAAIEAAVDAENKAASTYRKEGLDKQDVAMTQTMDASDPPSTNMGDKD